MSDNKSEKSQKLSIKSRFSKCDDKFLKDEVKGQKYLVLNPPRGLNEVLMKNQTSIKTEQEEVDELVPYLVTYTV